MSSLHTCSAYLEAGLILVPLKPLSKRPIPHPETGSWWRISDQTELDNAVSRNPDANFAILCGNIVQVDTDSEEALNWAKARGLASEGAWTLRTSRGWRLFFRAPEPCPPKHVDGTHQLPDLLGPGSLAVVPPSVHPSGFRYVWVAGRSPMDIVPCDLAALPERIVSAWWETSGGYSGDRTRPTSDAPGWLSLVFEAIARHLEESGHRLHPARDGGFTTTCPLHHDRNPSFSLHPERGWKCFAGCGEGRLTLLAARLGVRVPED